MKALKNTLNFRGSGESRYDLLKNDELWQSCRDKLVSACRCAVRTRLTRREKTKSGIDASAQYSSSWTKQFLKNTYVTHLRYTFSVLSFAHVHPWPPLMFLNPVLNWNHCRSNNLAHVSQTVDYFLGQSETFPNDCRPFWCSFLSCWSSQLCYLLVLSINPHSNLKVLLQFTITNNVITQEKDLLKLPIHIYVCDPWKILSSLCWTFPHSYFNCSVRVPRLHSDLWRNVC